MTTTVVSAITDLLKKTYGAGSLKNFASRKSVAFRQIAREDVLYGESKYLYFNATMGAGVSHTYADAIANAVTGPGYRMEVTRKKLYGAVDLDAEAMLASSNDMGSYIALKMKAMEDRAMELEQTFCRELFGDGTGLVGTLTAISGSGPWDCTVSEGDIINFWNGQVIKIDDAATGASLEASAYTVSRVDYAANTFRLTDETAGTDPSLTYKYLFVEGDAANGGSQLVTNGFSKWLPATVDTLNGLDRSVAPAQLAGFRATVTGTIEEAAKDLARKVLRFADLNNTALVMSSSNWQRLENELGSKVVRDSAASQKFGTSAISLQTPGGNVSCIADPWANDSASFLLDFSSWAYWTCKPLPHIIGSQPGEDGLWVRKKESTDAYTIQWRGMGDLVCKRPQNNGRLIHS